MDVYMGKSYVNGCLVRNLQTKWTSLAGKPIDFYGLYRLYPTIIYVPTNFNNGLDNLHAHKQLIEYQQVLDQTDSINYVLYIHIYILYTNFGIAIYIIYPLI